MRRRCAQVREAMGPEAVILSTGTIGDEVEVVAAIDFEVARERRRVRAAPAPPDAEPRPSSTCRRVAASSQLSEALRAEGDAAPPLRPLAVAAPAATAAAAQPRRAQ